MSEPNLKREEWIWWLYFADPNRWSCTELEEETADVEDLKEDKDADNDLEEEIEAESEELVAAEGVQESLANKVERDKSRIVYLSKIS